MGLFNWIVDIFELIYEQGEKELLNEDKYKEALNDLFYRLESGEITEEEYEEEEKEILDQLRDVRKYKKEHEIDGE